MSVYTTFDQFEAYWIATDFKIAGSFMNMSAAINIRIEHIIVHD